MSTDNQDDVGLNDDVNEVMTMDTVDNNNTSEGEHVQGTEEEGVGDDDDQPITVEEKHDAVVDTVESGTVDADGVIDIDVDDNNEVNTNPDVEMADHDEHHVVNEANDDSHVVDHEAPDLDKPIAMMSLKQTGPKAKKQKLAASAESSSRVDFNNSVSQQADYDARVTQLPVSKIKTIMRRDPDVTMVGADAAFLVTRATELFVQYLAYKANEATSQNKRKTVQKKDILSKIVTGDNLEFLEGNVVGSTD